MSSPTNGSLQNEVDQLRRRVAELERSEAERRQAEETLNRQTLVLQSILENLHDGVAVADTEGKFFLINPAARKIGGLSRPESSQADWPKEFGVFRSDRQTLFPVEELPIVRALRGETVDDAEIFLRNETCPEGRWLTVTARPLCDARGRALGGMVVFRDVTSRKQEDDLLRASEERFRSFMDNSPAVAFLKDVQGRYLYYNKPHAEFFNHGRTEWLGKTVFELFPEPVARMLHAHDQEVLRTGKTLELNESVPAPDGTPHEWLVFKFPVRGIKGEQGVGGVAVDITPRCRAEQALRESEQNFRQLAENIREVLWISDTKRAHYISPVYEEVFGRSCQSLYEDAESWMEAIHPDDRPRVLEAYQTRRDRFSEEYRIIRPDGTVRWIWDRAFPICVPQRHASRLVGMAEDITERKLADMALRASEERFRLLSVCSPVGIFLTDTQGRCIYANPRCLEVAGRDFEEIRDVNWAEHIHGDDRERVLTDWQQAAPAGRPFHTEFRFQTRTGETRWLQIQTAPMFSDDGVLNGHIGTTEDVTARRLADAQLKDYAQHLQTLSRRLLEVQEQERRHLACELHDEVGQLITGLKLTLEMVTRSSGPEVRVGLDRAQALVRDVTTRVRDLSLWLRPTMLDDLGLLPALLWHLERYTEQTQVQVAFEKSGIDRRFSSDIETTAYRIVQEALTNVARHAGIGQATLRVWIAQNVLHVQVEDTGRGFDVGTVQAEGRSSGLSGMQERTHLLNGQLRIETGLGTGTRITAELPLAHPAALPSEPGSAEWAAPTAPVPHDATPNQNA